MLQTMKIADKWLKDLPQQFQGKKRIEVLITAFARQMEEVRKVFDDVNRLTDIDMAHGINLDRVGDIVVLSRKDAQVILRSKTDQELGDETYRQVLRYKSIKNTCDCTYEDIVGTMKLLWDVDYITYVEKPERPATIFMQMPPFDINITDPAAKRVLAIRPAGVGLIYAVPYHLVADHSRLEKIFLVKLRLHWFIPFWGCYIFDGTWNLDGSVQLCQKRRYDLRLGLKYYMGIFYELAALHTKLFDGTWNLDGSVRLDAAYRSFRLKIYGKIDNVNKAGNPSVRETLAFIIDFWRLIYFDGRWKLDGKVCMDASRCKMEAAVKTHIAVNGNTEEIRDGPVEIRRNLWFLDGNVAMDGSRILNAMYRREVL